MESDTAFTSSGSARLTSAQQLHTVEDVVFDTGHEESTAQCRGQYGSEEAPPALCTVVTHHVVQQPEDQAKTQGD